MVHGVGLWLLFMCGVWGSENVGWFPGREVPCARIVAALWHGHGRKHSFIVAHSHARIMLGPTHGLV